MNETAIQELSDPCMAMIRRLWRPTGECVPRGPACIGCTLDTHVVKQTLQCWARRLSFWDGCSTPETLDAWLAMLCSHLLEKAQSVDWDSVKDKGSYTRMMLKTCRVSVIREYVQGAYHHKSGVEIKPGHDSDEAMTESKTSEQLEMFRRIDLEMCVILQIKRLVSNPVEQEILIAIYIQDRRQIDIALEFGKSDDAINRIKAKYQPELKLLVKQQCLGDE